MQLFPFNKILDIKELKGEIEDPDEDEYILLYSVIKKMELKRTKKV